MSSPADSPERIVAAAIKTGQNIFTGPHHSTIIHYMVACAKIKPVTGEQGFVTDQGRFVNRKEARFIAIASNQVKSEDTSEFGLMSENLWSVPDFDLQIHDALIYLDAGRLFDLEGTEIPTSLAERAKWIACALDVETNGHREAREKIRLLKKTIEEQIVMLTRLIGDENE